MEVSQSSSVASEMAYTVESRTIYESQLDKLCMLITITLFLHICQMLFLPKQRVIRLMN